MAASAANSLSRVQMTDIVLSELSLSADPCQGLMRGFNKKIN
jgi:hypothetical protein